MSKLYGDRDIEKLDEDGIKHRDALYKRLNIEGVDCVVGSGNYDTTASVSCDWARKDQYKGDS